MDTEGQMPALFMRTACPCEPCAGGWGSASIYRWHVVLLALTRCFLSCFCFVVFDPPQGNSRQLAALQPVLQFFRETHGLGCFATILVVCILHALQLVDCSKLLYLSYVQPAQPGQEALYKTGWDDLWLVAFWVVLLTGLRVVVQKLVLQPIGAWGVCT